MKTKITITVARKLVREELERLTTAKAVYRHRFGNAPSIAGEPKLRLFDYGGVPRWWHWASDGYIHWREYQSLAAEWKSALVHAAEAAEAALKAAIERGDIIPPSPAAGKVASYEGLPYMASRGTVWIYATVDVATGEIVGSEVLEDTSDDI